MIVLTIKDDDVKVFMSKLIKEDIFDGFEVRGIDIETFTNFHIDGVYNKKFFCNGSETETQEESTEVSKVSFCSWKDLKGYVFSLIKGANKPLGMKFIFSVKDEELENYHQNAKSLFLNIIFEKDLVRCISGSSQKNFSLDKSLDLVWDDYISEFLENNGIGFSIEE